MRCFEAGGWTGVLFGEVYREREWSGDATSTGLDAPMGRLADAVVNVDRECLASLDGSFAIVLYHRPSGSLYLVSDRYGSKRFFFGANSDGLWFFPRLRYFRDLGFELDFNESLRDQLLTFRYVVSDQTILRGVEAMPPASVVQIEGDKIERSRYWSWRFDDAFPEDDRAEPDEPALAREMQDLLLIAVERRIEGKSRVAIPISGGFDSRALLGAVLESRPAKDVTTVTFGAPGTLDYEIGCHIGRSLGTRHLALDLTRPRDYLAEYERQSEDCDGMVEPFEQVFLSDWQRIAAEADHIVSGYMGDHQFGSHLKPDMMRSIDEAGGDPDRKYERLWEKNGWSPPQWVAKLAGRDAADHRDRMIDFIKETCADNHHRHLVGWHQYWDLTYRQRKFIIPCVLKMEERMSYLTPFLDRDLVNFCSRLPPKMLLRQRLYRRVIRQAFPSLARIPTKNTGEPLRPTLPYLAARSAQRVYLRLVGRRSFRYPFFPGLRRGDRAGFNYLDYPSLALRDGAFREVLSGLTRGAIDRGLVDPEAVESLLAEHLEGRADTFQPLFCLAGIELAHRCFER